MKLHTLQTHDEHMAINDKAVADGFFRDDHRIMLPGTVWPEPFYYDPTGELVKNGKRVMIPDYKKGELGFLSSFYWRDWSDTRAPWCIVLPNGELWECDRKSNNGEGWIITGEGLNISAWPSINAKGYHGWLKDGVFSDDVEGRGPTGVWPYP